VCVCARDSFACRIAQETAGEEDEGVGTALHCTALLLVTVRPLISYNRAGGGEAAPNQRVPCRGAGHGGADAGCSGRGVDFSSNVRVVVMIVIALWHDVGYD
jgi:hypothetical protein